MTTHATPSFEIVPIDGYLAVQFDPQAVLAHANAPDMLAELLCSLGGSNGCPMDLTGDDVQDYIRDHATQGQKLVVQVHP